MYFPIFHTSLKWTIIVTVASYSNESVSFKWEWLILYPSSLSCPSFLVRDHPYSTYGSMGGSGKIVCTFYWTKGPSEIIFFQAFTKIPTFYQSRGGERLCTAFVDKAGHVRLQWRGMQKFTEILAIQGNQPSHWQFILWTVAFMPYCYLDINVIVQGYFNFSFYSGPRRC